ncbi:MAG TPA: lipid-transfer protein [Amycolatopsis sp.]|nr:lipid-transfer protein [Amycolatopsis sp.]
MSDRAQAAIAGFGMTELYKRGTATKTLAGLCCEAILAACRDAGISPHDIDGFTSYADETPPDQLAEALGMHELRYAGAVFGGGGGGSCAAIGNAANAIAAGDAEIVVLYHAMRRTEERRYGGAAGLAYHPGSEWASPFGLMTPAQSFAMIVRRHMHEYGTKPEHLAALAITQREHAVRNPLAKMRKPLTLEDYFAARIIADPFRLFDCTLENDGAAAIVVTSAARAADLAQPPAFVKAVSQGGPPSWANPLYDHNALPEIYPTAGHSTIARNLYRKAGIGPADLDVAELYDHFTGMVLLQLEDYGIAERGQAGAYVEAGHARWDAGKVAVNTHGGNISEGNVHGTTHIIEAVRQLRGTSSSQVEGAELALVTAGPSMIPSSSMILAKEAS